MMSRLERRKLGYAVDIPPNLSLWWLAVTILAILAAPVSVNAGPPAGGAIGGLFVMSLVLALQADATKRRRIAAACERAFEALGDTPFDVAGWQEYLVADLPWIAVELEQPIADVRLAIATRGFDGRIVIEKHTSTRFRFYLPPRGIIWRDPIGAVKDTIRWGDPKLARRMFEDLIAPLHSECGVRRVEMGGEQ